MGAPIFASIAAIFFGSGRVLRLWQSLRAEVRLISLVWLGFLVAVVANYLWIGSTRWVFVDGQWFLILHPLSAALVSVVFMFDIPLSFTLHLKLKVARLCLIIFAPVLILKVFTESNLDPRRALSSLLLLVVLFDIAPQIISSSMQLRKTSNSTPFLR
jgi:hypothetical protein